MSRVQVTAWVDPDDLMDELDSADLAEELQTRADRGDKIAKRCLLNFGQLPTIERAEDLINEIEETAASGDRIHFGVLMCRMRAMVLPDRQSAPIDAARIRDAAEAARALLLGRGA